MAVSTPPKELTPTLKTKITRKRVVITHPLVRFKALVAVMDKLGSPSTYDPPTMEQDDEMRNYKRKNMG